MKMKFLSKWALSAACLPLALFAQTTASSNTPAFNTSTTSVVPQLVDGGGITTLLIITNIDPNNSANYRVNFYGDNGQPAMFNFSGIGSVNRISGSAPAGASIFYITNGGSSSQTQGFAMKDSSGTDGTIGITQVLNIINPSTGAFNSQATYEAVPSSFSNPVGFPFDNTNGNVSSMAAANTNPGGTETVNVTVKDSSGNTLGSHAISLTTLTHTAFILSNSWPETANTRGTIIFQPVNSGNTVNMAFMALRFAPLTSGFTVTALPLLTR